MNIFYNEPKLIELCFVLKTDYLPKSLKHIKMKKSLINGSVS